MHEELSEILKLAALDEFNTVITFENVVQAKDYIKRKPESTEEFFLIVCAMNLINAGIKTKEFKEYIHYGMLKPRVSKLLLAILEDTERQFDIQFYINESQQCAYIEIYGLQFGFHNITIYDELKIFINSAENKPVEWKGIRLQKVANELFNYAVKINEME
ncbi:hypothetical protein [Flavobacterium sp.]|uniref:hypothetical protein n=1 Tax=Flavobacterium sp. TaxID=239 RepID=UPI0031E0CE95